MILRNRIRSFPASLAVAAALALSAGAVAQKSSPAKSAGDISVSVSGSPVEFGGGKPMMQGESVLVPFRAVLEKLGSTVQYDPSTKRIDATTSRHSVQLTPGSTAARVNDRAITMSVAPKVVAGTLYIPLRFVSESLGATVQYDAAGKTVSIQPASQDATTETQTMNEANSPSNTGTTDTNTTNLGSNTGSNTGDMNTPTNTAGNVSGNIDANVTTNDANGADTTGLSSDPANNGAVNDSTVTNNAPTNTAPANTSPATTSTVAPTSTESTSTEPSFFEQNMWPILGVLAALALAAIVYFALKGRRPGQVIASNSDNGPK